jgi:hypothetical protein
MKYLALIAAILFVIPAYAQDLTTIKPKVVPPDLGKQIVTEAEAHKVFARMETVLKARLAITFKTSSMPIGSGTKPVTRDQVIAEFSRMWEAARPKFKLTPKPKKIDSKPLRSGSSSAAKQLEGLVKAGAVANYSRLAVGPSMQLTTHELGDAIGFFMARLAQVTHMPSSKYSPPLMPR